MSNGIKDKLEEFIETIKSKLSRNSDDDEYEDEFEEEGEESEFDEKTEEISVKDKTGASIDESEDVETSDDEEEDDEDEDEDEEEEDDEAAAAKKKQMIIRGAIAVIALYLAYDTFLGTPEGPVVEEKQAKNFKRPKRKKRKKRKKTPVVKKAAQEADTSVKVEKPVPSPEPKKSKVIAPVPTPEPKKAEVVAPIEVDKIPEPFVEKMEPKIAPSDPMPTTTPKYESLSLTTPKEEKSTIGESLPTPVVEGSDVSNALDKLSDSTPKAVEKLVKEKLEYQEPPTYLETGRGLVYNCIGKHWACVDQASYLNCKKNAQWSKENNKPAECFPSDVYQNFKDCRVIQVDRINTLFETTFCE